MPPVELRLGLRLGKQLANDNGRPRIGLALGGGVTRGHAHLGALKTLLEADITIEIVAGTSMGAVIGAAYLRDMGQKKWRALPFR